MLKCGITVAALAAGAVLSATASPALALPVPTTPAWIGPASTGGPAAWQLDPVTTPTGSVRPYEPTTGADETARSGLGYQRFTAAGWGPAITVLPTTNGYTPDFDAAATTADDTTVRFAVPVGAIEDPEHVRFVEHDGTTTTRSFDLGEGDTPDLATDSTGTSVVLRETGPNADVLVATHLGALTDPSPDATLQASDVGTYQVVATGVDTFLAVWTQNGTPDATVPVPGALKYSTYAAGTWSTASTVNASSSAYVLDLISAGGRQLLETIDVDSGVTTYLVLAAGTWTPTSTRTVFGPLTAAPDGTIYAAGDTLGTLPVGSTTWSAEGPPAPGLTSESACEASTPPGFTLVYDNALQGLRTLQNVLDGSVCSSVSWVLGARTAGSSLYTPVTPTRVLDTRSALGAPKAPLKAGGTITLSFAGKVPASATAVALNLTGTGATASTYITGYPTGTARPTASSLNLVAGQTAAGLGVFKLSAQQTITLYNYAGSTNLIGDLAGYQSPNGVAYTAVTPNRVLDTRSGTGAPRALVGPQGRITLSLQGIVPADATAVALNITGAAPSTATYVTAYPTGPDQPTASTLNLAKGETRSNLAILKLGAGQSVTLYNNLGTLAVIGDLAGYYGATGASYSSVTPQRVLDTRSGLGGPRGLRGPGSTLVLSLAGKVPASATAVVLTITGVSPNHPSYLTAYPTGQAKPTTSVVNTAPGRATPNLAIVKLGTDQTISLYEGIGSEHVLADLVGSFQ